MFKKNIAILFLFKTLSVFNIFGRKFTDTRQRKQHMKFESDILVKSSRNIGFTERNLMPKPAWFVYAGFVKDR